MTAAARVWRAGEKTIALARPVVVGIVNVTPDSFSDGGRTFSTRTAVEYAVELANAGADVIDIGGESTRPGATQVQAKAEILRVVPVIEGVRAVLPELPLSIDTVKAEVARAALAAGADIVNDVSGLRLDEKMAAVCAAAGCGVVIMHSRGPVEEMATYAHATYGADVTADIAGELASRIQAAKSAGIKEAAIVLDPGFGFSKRTEHSLVVLRELPRIVEIGFPVLVGLSRKRMIGELSGVEHPVERDAETTVANVCALTRGARLFRVHDVRMARRALDLAWRLLEQ